MSASEEVGVLELAAVVSPRQRGVLPCPLSSARYLITIKVSLHSSLARFIGLVLCSRLGRSRKSIAQLFGIKNFDSGQIRDLSIERCLL